MKTIPFTVCDGSVRDIRSRYGGNDPDTWDAGPCKACNGSGDHRCDQCGADDARHITKAWGRPHLVCEDCWREELEAIAHEA